jgi:hypothetical protein
MNKKELGIEKNSTELQSVDLNEKILQLEKELAELRAKNQKENKTESSEPVKFDASRYITVVHLLDNEYPLKTVLKVDENTKYELGSFGEKLRLRQPDFERFYYNCKGAFEKNVVGLTSEDQDIIDQLGIKSSDVMLNNSALFRDFPNMSEDQMKKFFNSLTSNHKQMIVGKWIAGYDDKGFDGKPKNPVFADINKIKFLNDLSGGLLQLLYDTILKDNENEEIKKIKKNN